MPAVVAHKANLTSKSTYVNHVSNGVDLPSVWEQLQGQLYLGDAKFAEVLGYKMGDKLAADEEIPRLQRRKSAPPLARFAAMPESTTAIVQAFATGCCGMTDNFWEMGDLTPLPFLCTRTSLQLPNVAAFTQSNYDVMQAAP